jgi:hypothetical protein
VFEPSQLEKYERVYAWMLLVVTVLPAIARVLRPWDLAQITWKRYEKAASRRRFLMMGTGYMVLALGLLPMYYLFWRQQRWVLLAFVYSVISAGEFILNARAGSVEKIARQNKIFGGLYAMIAIATWLLLFYSR